MKIQENVPISQLTTMRLGGEAAYVSHIESIDDIAAAYDFAAQHDLPTWIMGGGANTIGHDEGFPGVILLNQLRSIYILQDGQKIPISDIPTNSLGDTIILKGMGGEVWDDFVAAACRLGYTGIEALSAIPGTVGAAPVQNIGAYGQEISQTLLSVEAYDRETGQIVTLDRSELRMDYRRTIFNHGPTAGRYFVVSVTVELHRGEISRPFYNSLQHYIDSHGITDFSPTSIRDIVTRIRADKLPDPAKVPSAGSFFKNVFIPASEIPAAESLGIPVWHNENGRGKINSGWLIEQCGFKGRELFGFRVSDKAALILINESATSYANLARARAAIVDSVAEKFGFRLEQEPVELTTDTAMI